MVCNEVILSNLFEHISRMTVCVQETRLLPTAPCALRGCKNRPAPFPDRMSYKATKPGLVLFYILFVACFDCIVAY